MAIVRRHHEGSWRADRDGHDAVPASARWHFINVPIGDARFDPRLIRDDNNVVVKIKQYRRVLSDRSRPKKERQRALLFFVHFAKLAYRPLDDAPRIIPRGYKLSESYLVRAVVGKVRHPRVTHQR